MNIPFNRSLLITLCCLLFVRNSFALGQAGCVEFTASPGSFSIFHDHISARVYVDFANDHAGVVRAVGDLLGDVSRVTGVQPDLTHNPAGLGKSAIVIGTIGKSELIDRWIRERKLDVSAITGKWESYLIAVVPKPAPGVDSALAIVGSDKRGTIYGIYDLSEQIGVSPWYWWADVPVQHHDALFVKAGRYVQGPPSVKYRGIFLNDEAPDLSNWIREKFGNAPGLDGTNGLPGNPANYGHEFYTKLFELILRLKGNYLWPAMWNNAFNEDDPENPRLADEYGVVMGTSHQEPMLRAQKEWDRKLQRQYGNWNYNNTNQQPVLQQFWREGIRRNKNFESIITLGLRAENDSGAPIGKELTEQIVGVQRNILAEEMNPDLTKVPQLWCLYKEVQGFYHEGLRVPDDVTLLWAEDNWGNVRRLPTAEERKRSGGAGVYYHFDYHGGPRSYQWINTSPIPKMWDQLSLAKQYGADRIWIVNVGHFKGYEFPLEYFMHLAWNTDRWTNEHLGDYTRLWAQREFGAAHANEIAEIITQYTRFNGRRKPELLEPTTYSLVNYQEAERVVAEYQAIVAKADVISAQLPEAMRDAFYELVLFPAKACAQLNELYLAAGKNQLYARQGRASANDFAARTRALFQAQTNLMDQFNRTFAGGKWNHFMDQSHLGYTSWADPPRNNLNAVRLTEIEVPEAAAMGVALEGSTSAWPGATNDAVLPSFDAFNQQRHYVEIFNKGKMPFDFTATAHEPWIKLSEAKGTIEKEKRLWVTVDWSRAPKAASYGGIKLTGANREVTVTIPLFNPAEPTRASLQGFVEGEDVVSIEAEHYTKQTGAGASRWIRIEDYGHTLSGMRANGPVDAPAATPGKDSPCLEYRLHLFSTGTVQLTAVTGPTLNFMPGRGIRFAVSLDEQPPQTVTLVPENYNAQNGNRDWEESVKDNARYPQTSLTIAKPGDHTLKVWMIDPGVVLEKLVLNTGDKKPSYLGPPESFHNATGVAGRD